MKSKHFQNPKTQSIYIRKFFVFFRLVVVVEHVLFFTKNNNKRGKIEITILLVLYFSSLTSFLPPLIRPVRRAAIRPTLRPALASRRTVEALPMC